MSDIDFTEPALVASVERAIGSRVLRAAVVAETTGHATMRGHRPYLHGESPDAILFRAFIDWCLGSEDARLQLLHGAEVLGITTESLMAGFSDLFVPADSTH